MGRQEKKWKERERESNKTQTTFGQFQKKSSEMKFCCTERVECKKKKKTKKEEKVDGNRNKVRQQRNGHTKQRVKGVVDNDCVVKKVNAITYIIVGRTRLKNSFLCVSTIPSYTHTHTRIYNTKIWRSDFVADDFDCSR